LACRNKKTRCELSGFFCWYRRTNELLDLYNVCRLKPFGTLGNIKGDLIAFGEGLEAVTLNSGEVNKNILTAFLLDEAETLGVVEPFNLAFCHFPASFFFSGFTPEQVGYRLSFWSLMQENRKAW
jgi:hypothetical protein